MENPMEILLIWMFPEIGVPPNPPFIDGIFPYKPSIVGYPHLWKPLYHETVMMSPTKPRYRMSPTAAQNMDDPMNS